MLNLQLFSVANWFKNNMLDNKENSSVGWPCSMSWHFETSFSQSSCGLLNMIYVTPAMYIDSHSFIPSCYLFLSEMFLIGQHSHAKATMDSSLLSHLPLSTCSTCCLCLFFESYKILCLILILGYVLYLIFIYKFLYSWLYIEDCTF